MNIFIVSQGQDTGGQGQRTAAAFRKYTDWTVNFMCAGETYIQYPLDIPWDVEVAQKLYDEADVVEHQNWLYGYAMYEHGDCKPTVIRSHGTPLRGFATEANREAQSINAVQIVSTVDLLDDAPHATWTPCFFDIDWLAKTYVHKPHEKIRIGHGPTVRAAKGTDTILATLAEICKRNKNVEVDLIEGVPWTESLRRKSNCDIWIDQLTLGYGLSGIEAMAMGIPVVTAWEDPDDCQLFLEQTNRQSLPFLQPMLGDPEGLAFTIQSLIDLQWVREELGNEGKEFVKKFHDEETNVRAMKEIYLHVPQSKGIGSLWLRGPVKKQAIVKRWRRNGKLRQTILAESRRKLSE